MRHAVLGKARRDLALDGLDLRRWCRCRTDCRTRPRPDRAAAPARSSASMVLSKVGPARLPAMASISSRLSAKAGRRPAGNARCLMRSNGGISNGVVHGSSSGFLPGWRLDLRRLGLRRCGLLRARRLRRRRLGLGRLLRLAGHAIVPCWVSGAVLWTLSVALSRQLADRITVMPRAIHLAGKFREECEGRGCRTRQPGAVSLRPGDL